MNKWMMLRIMGVPFFLMNPFNETTRLRGLLLWFLSALQFYLQKDKYKSQKSTENAIIFTLCHYINLQKKKKKSRTSVELPKLLKN